MKRLLITGAAGHLGGVMRKRLASLAGVIRVSDIAEMPAAGPNEEVVRCDLADEAAVNDLVAGCDGIVHLGGISVERTYDLIEDGNLRGVYNLYEAARANGHPRIIFASSNHAVGYYKQTEMLTQDMPTRPDGLYGVSKVFGEAIAQMYHDKFGVETAIVRIGSCTAKPENHRMLATWFSYDDFAGLIAAAFTAPTLGCPTVWGISNNASAFWANLGAPTIGWFPKDNADHFRAEIDAMPLPAADDPVRVYQGGVFTANPIFKE